MDLQEQAGWDADWRVNVNGRGAMHYTTWPLPVETDVSSRSGRSSHRRLEIAHDSAGVMACWPLPGAAAFAMRRLVTNVTGPGWPRPLPCT